MTGEPTNQTYYIAVWSNRPNQPIFVDMNDEQAIENARDQLDNRNLSRSVCSFAASDISAERAYPLYFSVCAADPESTRISGAEMACYLSEWLNVPEEYLEFIYVPTSCASGAGAQRGNPGTQIIARIAPSVFGTPRMSLMLLANYNLARQMIRDGLKNVQIDIYVRDYAIPLPGSLWNDRFINFLTMKELLHLDAQHLDELSRTRQGEDCLIDPPRVPQAAQRLDQALRAAEAEQAKQQWLRHQFQHNGWFIPPCVDRLMWADLPPRAAIEACRVLARYYALAGAHSQEIWHHILRLDRRHGVKDYPYIENIVRFGIEHPAFVGCDHRLLQELCRAGNCGMIDLLAECEEPLLFR